MVSNRICVGAIAGSFGINGEVRLKSFCADPAAIANYAPLTTETNLKGFSLTITKPVKNGFAASLSGIKTREQADALRGQKLFADRTKFPELTEEEYYHTDLIGLLAIDSGGETLGTVKDVLNHGATDLLEIQSGDRSDTILIPFTRQIVPTVDLASGRIILDLPDGLLNT